MNELIGSYIDAILLAQHNIRDLDVSPAKSNKSVDAATRILREIKSRGDEAVSAMLKLLDDPRPGIRSWVANEGIRLAPEKAEAVLLELAKGDDRHFAKGAQLRLTEWKEGYGRFRMDGDPPFELRKQADGNSGS